MVWWCAVLWWRCGAVVAVVVVMVVVVAWRWWWCGPFSGSQPHIAVFPLVPRRTVLYHPAPHCAVPPRTALCCTTPPHCAVPPRTALCCTTPHRVILGAQAERVVLITSAQSGWCARFTSLDSGLIADCTGLFWGGGAIAICVPVSPVSSLPHLPQPQRPGLLPLRVQPHPAPVGPPNPRYGLALI